MTEEVINIRCDSEGTVTTKYETRNATILQNYVAFIKTMNNVMWLSALTEN